MPGIDLSNYPQKNKKTALPVTAGDESGRKKKFIYLVVIVLCLVGIIFLFKDMLFAKKLTVEETLPPGVPLEAPPLDQLPSAVK